MRSTHIYVLYCTLLHYLLHTLCYRDLNALWVFSFCLLHACDTLNGVYVFAFVSKYLVKYCIQNAVYILVNFIWILGGAMIFWQFSFRFFGWFFLCTLNVRGHFPAFTPSLSLLLPICIWISLSHLTKVSKNSDKKNTLDVFSAHFFISFILFIFFLHFHRRLMWKMCFILFAMCVCYTSAFSAIDILCVSIRVKKSNINTHTRERERDVGESSEKCSLPHARAYIKNS